MRVALTRCIMYVFLTRNVLISFANVCAGLTEIVKDSVKPYTESDSNNWKTIVSFDCRGCEPTSFSFRNGFTVSAVDSSTTYQDANLEELEWVEYDEKTSQSVGIYEAESKFIKL